MVLEGNPSRCPHCVSEYCVIFCSGLSAAAVRSTMRTEAHRQTSKQNGRHAFTYSFYCEAARSLTEGPERSPVHCFGKGAACSGHGGSANADRTARSA